MVDYEALLSDCVEFIGEKIFGEVPMSAVSVPVPVSSFESEGVIDGNWRSLVGISDSYIKRDIQLCTFKKILLEIVGNGKEDKSKDEKLLQKLAVTLDCVHYVQMYGNNDQEDGWASMWINLYFDLAKMVIQLLRIPDELLAFFPYFESRLQWYVQGQEIKKVFYGCNNLVYGIKPPLSRLLYYCNDLTHQLEAQSKINTPMHYRVINKIQWLMSQLLPMEENCNYNKSCEIISQVPDTLWSNKVRTCEARQPSLFVDWNHFFQDFLLDPLGIMLTPLRDRQVLEEYTSDIVDFLLENESKYYRIAIDLAQESNIIKNGISNGVLFNNFANLHFRSHEDSRFNISDDKADFWKRFSEFHSSMNNMMHILPLELEIDDEKAFSTQMETIELDIYRKLALIQVMVVCKVIDKIISDSTTFKLYATRYKNANHTRSLLLDPPSQFKFFSSVSRRITDFYKEKDHRFYEVLNEVLNSEEFFLMSKLNKMADFKEIKWNLEPINGKPHFDYSFKKFGFIKLGNKELDQVWRIESGLEKHVSSTKDNELLPSVLYNQLKSQQNAVSDGLTTCEDNEIVKQWQILRSLRFQCLFDFNLVDENTGLNGLFDAGLIEKSKHLKRSSSDQIVKLETKKHQEELAKAIDYFDAKSKSTVTEDNKTVVEVSENPLKRNPESPDPIPDT